jgi:hypothetical protein
MGTQRPRRRNFFYPTIDPRAIPPLLEHVPAGTVFAEPCAGAGDLVHLLEQHGLVCDWALELEPQGSCLRNRWPIGVGDALGLTRADLGNAQCFISNFPWSRDWLHPLISHLAEIAPVWSLHDASWCMIKKAARFAPLCTDVVAVGRLKWFAGSKYDPPDDCAWYRFEAADTKTPRPTRFHFPVERGEKARAGQPVFL